MLIFLWIFRAHTICLDLFAQRRPLADRLAQLLKRPVELIPEHELNRHMREQVLREVVEL
jgi:uncharacterized protein